MWHKSLLIFNILLLTLVSKGQESIASNHYLLSKAQEHIRGLEFGKAIDCVEKYQLTEKVEKDTLLFATLGDCYWKLRAYKKAQECYEILSSKKDFVLPEVVRFRMAEYAAGQKNYTNATSLLNGIAGFQDKQKGFGQVQNMMRDSLDYRIQNLKINTKLYREFAPSIIGGRLFFSTNQPENLIIPAVASIDGAQYFHLKQLFDTAESTATTALMNSQPSLSKDAGMTNKKPKKIALSFEGSDVALLNRVSNSAEITRDKKVNKDIRLITQTLTGVSAYQFYNVTNFSYSPTTNKVYFTVNQDKPSVKTKGSPGIHVLRIAEADLQDFSLRKTTILPLKIDSNFSLMHPAIHPNGKLLVFSSNQSENQFDLYYSTKDSAGWSKPISLDVLNTKGEEVFPSFTPDGSLYFSSNGRAGLGGLDIYSIRLQMLGGDNKINHLSYPINSGHDDFGYTSNQDRIDRGYFSSDRNGSDDVFSYEKRPVNIKLEGFVLNEATGLRKKNVKVLLIEDHGDGNKTIVDSLVTDITGNYKFQSKPNRNYIVSLRDSVNDYKELFVNNNEETLTKTLPVVALKSIDSIKDFSASNSIQSGDKTKGGDVSKTKDTKDGGLAKVKNASANLPTINTLSANGKGNTTGSEIIKFKFVVYYQLNQSTHNAESLLLLDSLISILNHDSKLYAVIGSFTDCKGSIPYNMMLSNKRSKATLNYLVANGIEMSRIIESHYGESYLNTACLTEQYQEIEQLLNRRTEIFVTPNNQLFWLDIHNHFLRTK